MCVVEKLVNIFVEYGVMLDDGLIGRDEEFNWYDGYVFLYDWFNLIVDYGWLVG